MVTVNSSIPRVAKQGERGKIGAHTVLNGTTYFEGGSVDTREVGGVWNWKRQKVPNLLTSREDTRGVIAQSPLFYFTVFVGSSSLRSIDETFARS